MMMASKLQVTESVLVDGDDDQGRAAAPRPSSIRAARQVACRTRLGQAGRTSALTQVLDHRPDRAGDGPADPGVRGHRRRPRRRRRR